MKPIVNAFFQNPTNGHSIRMLFTVMWLMVKPVRLIQPRRGRRQPACYGIPSLAVKNGLWNVACVLATIWSQLLMMIFMPFSVPVKRNVSFSLKAQFPVCMMMIV